MGRAISAQPEPQMELLKMVPLRGSLILFLLLISSSKPFCQPIGRIYIKGNFRIPTDLIRNQMITRENHWWSHHHFEQKVLEVDLVKISAFYHRHGFLGAEVKADTSLNEEGKINITLTVHEGPQTRVSRVRFSGVSHLLGKKLPQIMVTKVGDPLSLKEVEEDKKRVISLYTDSGYPYVRVEPSCQLSSDSSLAEVQFQVREGALVRYGRIKVRGLKSVREQVVTRELIIKSGEVYRRTEIEESQQRIYSTGLFNWVRIYAENPFEKPENPDFIVSVMERENKWFGLRSGLGQDEQHDVTFDLTGEWGNRNIGGNGRKLILSITLRFQVIHNWANLKNRFAATYTEPWFLHTRTPLSFRLYFDPGVKERILGYRIQRLGGDLDLSHELRRDLVLRLGYSYERVDIFDVSPTTAEKIKREEGITIRRRIGLSATKDTRDNVFLPQQGSWTQFSSSLVGGPLGGDYNFYRVIGSWCRYQMLIRNLIFATRLKIGLAWPFASSKELPSTDWFLTGGGGSIRGYAEEGIALKDTLGNAIGGRTLLVSNLELRFPLFWRLGGTVFLDGGGVWRDQHSPSLSGVNLSIGCGIQLFTPVGPLRLDYGQRIVSKWESLGGDFHFGILYSF